MREADKYNFLKQQSYQSKEPSYKLMMQTIYKFHICLLSESNADGHLAQNYVDISKTTCKTRFIQYFA